jgi:amino acid transporter
VTYTDPNGGPAKFNRVLGTPSLVMFGLAYMVPLGVFTTYGIVTAETAGHLPAAYILTTVTMLFTALSYGKMVRLLPSAGSAYAYARRAFGARPGFIVGWALLVDYVLLPMLNYLVIGLYLHESFPSVPNGVWIVLAIVLTTALNILGIKLVMKTNVVLLAVQLVFIVVFVALCIRTVMQGNSVSLVAPFVSGGLELHSVTAGAAVLALSFLGFDAISTLSEDSKNSTTVVPRAIILTTLIGGAMFLIVAYAGHLVFPDWEAFTNVDAAALDVIGAAGGAFLAAFFTAAYVVGCFASATVSQTSVARILYAMGRDKVLPSSLFGYLHPRLNTPVRSLLFIGAVSLVALVMSLTLASSLISFGALVAFTVTNIAVIKCYIVDQRARGAKNMLNYGLLPGIGATLTIWLWTSLSTDALLLGVVWAAIGLIYLLWLTRFFTRSVPEMSLGEEEQRGPTQDMAPTG